MYNLFTFLMKYHSLQLDLLLILDTALSKMFQWKNIAIISEWKK